MEFLGCVLILAAIIDIYQTVLFPRGGPGFLCGASNRLLWRLASGSTRSWSPQWRHRMLAHVGPLMVVFDIVLWGLLLLLGFAMIAYPALGHAIVTSGPGPTPQNWATAFYYAGYSLTTLGTGDLVPQTRVFRLLMIVQAALGFAYLTLSLTFFMSVYDALHRQAAFALTLDHRTGGTGSPRQYVVRLLAGSDWTAARRELAEVTERVAAYYEAHHFYPVLHFFRLGPSYSLPRIAFVLLDSCTLLDSALEEDRRHLLAADVVAGAARSLIRNLPRDFVAGSNDAPRDKDDAAPSAWQEHYRRVVRDLQQAGVRCRSDLDASCNEYAVRRREWEPMLRRIADYLRYDWPEIAVAGTESVNGAHEQRPQ